MSCSLGSVGKSTPSLFLVFSLELEGQLLQVVGVQLHILLHALALLHLVDESLEILLAHFHNHVGVHLDEPAVAVPGPAGIAGLGGHNRHHVLIQAQVQNGIHHAGHGGPGAGTDGHQQGIFLIAELLAGDLFQLVHIGHDLGLDFIVDLAAVLVILGAGLRRNSKALRDRQSDIGHFGQIRPLATQKLPHFTVTLGKEIDIFVRHAQTPFKSL